MIISVILLSISLSIDSLGIGTTYGLRGITLSNKAKIIISVQSILITGLALLIGRTTANIFPTISKNIGIFMLIFMGVLIIYQGLNSNTKKTEIPKKNNTIFSLIIKSLGITIQIIRTPRYCDMDNSKQIDIKEGLYLGLALSIDSIGAGFGSGASGIFMPILPFLTALCQIIFLSSGILLGKKLKCAKKIKENIWTMVSGILLIIIGFLRLI